MEWLALVRAVGALGVVLGLLWGALWAVRRYDLRLPGGGGGGRLRRIELVERIALDPRRSIALIRRDTREHLILLTPEGATVLETGIVRRTRRAVEPKPAPTPAATLLGNSFPRLVERVREAQAARCIARTDDAEAQ